MTYLPLLDTVEAARRATRKLKEGSTNGPHDAQDFRDITVGNNLNPQPINVDANGNTIIPGLNTSAGWDPVTRLGSPDAALLLPDLIAAVNAK